MSISIPDLLEGILEATAAEAAAKARIVAYRGALEDEGRRRLAADGAAPSWNAPNLGKVRLEPAGDWTPAVADPVVFGSWVADHHPTEATAVLRLPAADLEHALEALAFTGLNHGPEGTVDLTIEVRPAWASTYLAGLAVDVEENGVTGDGNGVRTIVVADTTTGDVVPGLTATSSPAKLVVSLDRGRRTAVVDEARTSANAAIADAIGEEQAAADLQALDTTRRELEALHGDQLATIAKAHGLGSSGTKAALAERIARAEHGTGRVVRPATPIAGIATMTDTDQPVGLVSVDSTPTPEPLPDDAEVEEVTTLEPLDQPAEDACLEVDGVCSRHTANNPDCTVYSERARFLDGLSREVLRRYAKAKGISAAGTKADVITRLVAAGTTVTDVNTHARTTTPQERTA